MDDWPACNPVAEKVNAGPLVVALFPLLPAMATIKLPFCGPLTTITASVPNRPLSVMLPTLTRDGSNVQVNSALANPLTGTLFRLTETVVVLPSATIFDGVKPIVTNADVGVAVGVAVVATVGVNTTVGVADGTKLVGAGVFVKTAVFVATGVLVATGVFVKTGVLVATGVFVAIGVLVKIGVFDGAGVGVAAICRIVRLYVPLPEKG